MATIRDMARILIPGLVIQAVMVGGGYATGRELVEFFIMVSPASGVLGMLLTAILFSLVAMVSFELARRFGAFDYRSFCQVYLGRLWVLFEAGYAAALLLGLSVVSAAAVELLRESLGWPPAVGHALFVTGIALLVFVGNDIFERVVSAWSLLFYLVYGVMFALVVYHFSDRIGVVLADSSIDLAVAAGSGISYSGYNIVLIPLMIFVARNFRSSREALLSGALAGPLILLPGAAFLIALMAFYPDIINQPLPVQTVLNALDVPALATAVRVIIFLALLKTGAALLHSFNERVSRAFADRHRLLPRWGRPVVSITVLFIAVVVASGVGLVDLIRHGYRFSSLYFTLVFVLPLLSIGLWRLINRHQASARAPALEVEP